MIVTVFSAVMAAELSGFHIPSTVQPQENQLEISVTVDQNSWTNGTQLDWQIITPGETLTKTLAVQNIDTKSGTIYIKISGLPLGYTLTWTANNTVVTSGSQIQGQLQLVAPDPITDYSVQNWDMWIISDPL